MKKLFGTKTKSGKASSRDFAEEGLKPQIPTPLYQKLATHGNHILQAPIGVGQPPALALAQGGLPPPGTPLPPPRSAAGADDERWEVVPTPLPSAMSTAPQGAGGGMPPDHLPNPHSPPSSALPPPSSAVQQIQAQHPQQLQQQQQQPQGQGQGVGQPIATVTPPSRTSSFTSLQASTQQQAQAPLPSAQHHPSVGVLPPRSGSPMSTASATTNKLVKHRDRDRERERERAERDAYAQSQSGDTNTKDKKKKKPSQPTAPVALGILRALDPPRAESAALSRQISEERATRTVSESGHGQGWGTSTYTGSVAGDRDPRSGYHRELSAGSGYGYREREPVPPPEKEKEKKRGFWSRDKDKDKDKEKERALEREREKALERERERVERDRPPDLQVPGQREKPDNLNHAHPPHDQERGREPRRGEENGAELTRMIGYLTATASEDWALVLDVCDRASANEANAKEAVRALRREFKYGEPAAQLSAARLWAIMLRNSSDIFITQSTTRKFLDTLEDLLSSSRTSPVVRERLLEVVAAAAYASGSKKGHDREGFKGLWRRVKPFDKPDEGVPFDTDDAMFHPPSSGRLSSGYDIPSVAYQEPTPPALESAPLTPAAPNPIKERSKRRSPTRSNRIIPLDEDMRRLFQECKIGQGNASLLAQALVTARPEDLKRQDIIREFYIKCRASQELIYAQIPWATAGAERAVANKEQRERERGAKNHTRNRTLSNDLNRAANTQGKDRSNSPPDGSDEGTQEEKLLAALLAANAELVEVLKQYDDLERVAMERKAEDRSRKEIRMDPRQRERLAAEAGAGGDSWSAPGGGASATTTTTTASRTPSPPSPQLSYQSHQQHLQQQQQNHYQQQQQQQLSNNNPYQQQRHQYPYQQQPPAPPSTQLAQPRPKHPGLPESYSYSSDINLLGANNSNINPSLSSVYTNPAPNSNLAPNPNLAPPPAAPHGPRSPAQAPSTHSRASSPATPSLGGHGHGVAAGGYGMVNGHSYAPSQGHQGNGYGSQHGHGTAYGQDYGRGQSYAEAGNRSDDDSGPDYEVPVKPSAKALGKRKVVEPEVSAGSQFDPDDIYATQQDNQFYGSSGQDPENLSDEEAYSDSHQRPAWARQPTHFVYDAVEERMKEWQMQLRQQEEQERTEGGRLMQQPQTVDGVANGGH